MDEICKRHDIVLNHLQKYFTNISNLSLQEIMGTLKIHVIPSSKEQNCLILATSGANIGNSEENYELLMYLPKDWDLSDLENICNYWPIKWIRELAYYENDVIPENTFSSEFYEPLAPNTQLSGILILPEVSDYGEIDLQNGETIKFLNIIPLYKEEIELKKKIGTMGLIEKFYVNNINMILDLNRLNVGLL